MRPIVAWADKVHDREGVSQCIYDLAFRPDGGQMIVAAGTRVLVYDTSDGDLIQSLKGHKGVVYCVAYSSDGKRFASGGADKTIIIWTYKLEGILKYSHNDSIQCIAYNPVTASLASCTAADFGLWSPEQKSVSKHKVPARVLCCSWTNDGQYLAMGLYSGQVTIRNKAGDEKVRIDRGTSPVWTISWNPNKDEPYDILAVCDWTQKLSFYQLSGRQVGKDRVLGFDACSMGYFSTGEFLVAGGSDKKVSLFTKEGVNLSTIGEQESWVWCCKPKPKQNFVAVGCQDGTICMYQLIFSTVHGLYQDRYAYRDNMTDVIIQHLVTEQKARIKCHDMVKKIAIYKDRLAVQMPDRVIIYELYNDESSDMHYRIREKINKKLDCNLLVVTSNHIILCMEKKLQLLSFAGVSEKEWILEALIRYIKVVGGPAGREGLLVGLKNGHILKIFVDNPFPVPLIKQQTAIRCLDFSSSRTKLAVVDENNTCLVYDVRTKDLLFQEPNANSVAWNTQNEDMLCFSGNGMLSIKAANFPIHQQKLQGFVVGFTGSKIFCLHVYSMKGVDVPQSASLYQYLDKRFYEDAYRIACLGVTESDWRLLATAALESMDLETAHRAFIRIRDLRFLELLANIEARRKTGNFDDKSFLADIYAYQGRIDEAAKIYKECGMSEQAVNMYTDLCMFDKAKEYMGAKDDVGNKKKIMKKQAEWAATSNDPMSAVNMYANAGEYRKAIDILGERGWMEKLVILARELSKGDTDSLTLAATYFRKNQQNDYASEMFAKMNDTKALIDLYIHTCNWDAAFSLATQKPEIKAEIYLPYARWLAEHDRFEEAQEAFVSAGRMDEAIKVLEQLVHNAVVESRFGDASKALNSLALGCLAEAKDAKDPTALISKFDQYRSDSEAYFAYNYLHLYTSEPFTSHLPESLFNMARFLMHRLMRSHPLGISKVATLYALAKQGRHLGAYKLARHAFDKLHTLKIPQRWQDTIDLGNLCVRTKPFHDKEDILSMCYRCSTINPLLNPRGNQCVNCAQPWVQSYYSFENLPLVEFKLEEGLSDEEALNLIEAEPHKSSSGGCGGDDDDDPQVTDKGGQSLFIEKEKEDSDPFTTCLLTFEKGGTAFTPVIATRSMVLNMPRQEVFVKKWPASKPYQYYRNIMPETSISMCKGCFHFFHSEDLEFVNLQNGGCQLCGIMYEDAQVINTIME